MAFVHQAVARLIVQPSLLFLQGSKFLLERDEQAEIPTAVRKYTQKLRNLQV